MLSMHGDFVVLRRSIALDTSSNMIPGVASSSLSQSSRSSILSLVGFGSLYNSSKYCLHRVFTFSVSDIIVPSLSFIMLVFLVVFPVSFLILSYTSLLLFCLLLSSIALHVSFMYRSLSSLVFFLTCLHR